MLGTRLSLPHIPEIILCDNTTVEEQFLQYFIGAIHLCQNPNHHKTKAQVKLEHRAAYFLM
jgi:hypothetical protein